MLDLTLWDQKIQVQTCVDSLKLIEHLSETNDACIDNIDSDECDPCTKHYDYFFDKYDVFVLQNILRCRQPCNGSTELLSGRLRYHAKPLVAV